MSEHGRMREIVDYRGGTTWRSCSHEEESERQAWEERIMYLWWCRLCVILAEQSASNRQHEWSSAVREFCRRENGGLPTYLATAVRKLLGKLGELLPLLIRQRSGIAELHYRAGNTIGSRLLD